MHPGIFIGHDLKTRHITPQIFAETVGVPVQTINDILSGGQDIPFTLAQDIEKALGYEEGLLLELQKYHHIDREYEKKTREQYPTAPNIRKCLFWDVDFDKINWGRYQKTVIQRVWERGDREEKEEIARYYNLQVEDLIKYVSFENHPLFNRHKNKKQ